MGVETEDEAEEIGETAGAMGLVLRVAERSEVRELLEIDGYPALVSGWSVPAYVRWGWSK